MSSSERRAISDHDPGVPPREVYLYHDVNKSLLVVGRLVLSDYGFRLERTAIERLMSADSRAIANARKLAESEDLAHNRFVDGIIAANMADRKSAPIKKRL